MTLTEYLSSHQLRTLFTGTKIDTSTQEAIRDFFQFRQLCDDEKFSVFFNRTVKLYQNQYLQLLRIETVEWDPMVTEYMERQIQRATEENRSTQSADTSTVTGGGSNSSSRTTTKDTEGTSEVKENGTTKSATKNSGTDLTENEAKKTGKRDTLHDESRTSDRTSKADTRGLSGQTPDSSLYPAAGFPEGLSWQYAGAQTETIADTKDNQEETSKSTDGETTSEDNNGKSRTTYGLKVDVDGTTSGTTTGTSGETVTEGETLTANSTSNQRHETSGTGSEESSTDEDTRERYTGRHQSPQELLDDAISYVMNANAFKWFLKQLDPCFYSVYEW